MDSNHWTPDRPISELPEEIREYFVKEADWLYHELEGQRLIITTEPAPDPRHNNHKVRKVEQMPPSWYSSMYWSRNKHFKRSRSLTALDRIRNERDKPFVEKTQFRDPRNRRRFIYDRIFRDLIYDRLIQGYPLEDDDFVVAPNEKVVAYFGVKDWKDIFPELRYARELEELFDEGHCEIEDKFPF